MKILRLFVLSIALISVAYSCTPENQVNEETQLTDKDTDRPGNQGGGSGNG